MTRTRLPDMRPGLTHTVTIAGQYRITFTVNVFADTGKPGELFLDEYEFVSEENGNTVNRTLDQWCIAISLLLQTGYDLKALVAKFGYTKYEPSGFTDNDKIREAKSVTDYIIRWIGNQYLPKEEEDE